MKSISYSLTGKAPEGRRVIGQGAKRLCPKGEPSMGWGRVNLKSRHWAVWKHEGDKAPQLLCVTLYKKGAQSIINELES